MTPQAAACLLPLECSDRDARAPIEIPIIEERSQHWTPDIRYALIHGCPEASANSRVLKKRHSTKTVAADRLRCAPDAVEHDLRASLMVEVEISVADPLRGPLDGSG